MIRNLASIGLATVWACLACDPRVCDDTAPQTRTLPARLSETGLFADVETQQLGPRVFPYAPAFALWSDGAAKRRWIHVPSGERVDTSTADDWRFPTGTKLWKEFTRDGVRVETRLLQKTGTGERDWVAVAYVWRPDQRDAERAPYGAINALGTAHDVPAAGECWACHAGRRSRALGFSAIQLGATTPGGERGLNEDAETALLSRALPPPFQLPGTLVEGAALGYLHANCSHCHNQSGAAAASGKCLDPNDRLDFDLDFSLNSDELTSTSNTATYRTALDRVIEPGKPGDSKLLELVEARGAFEQMPPLATERVDADAVHLLREWIAGL
jgi:hypothetical protein